MSVQIYGLNLQVSQGSTYFCVCRLVYNLHFTVYSLQFTLTAQLE